jgi:RNA polymerase sigma factor (TIGR02999 family)
MTAMEFNEILDHWRKGDTAALNELMPAVYSELHRIAQSFSRDRRPGQTLQPTALINEADLNLFGGTEPQFADRAHFLAVMARVMRQVLIDHARAATAGKRGGEMARVDWDTAVRLEADGRPRLLQVLHVDHALELLGNENEKLAQVIEMHYFGGMTAEEIAIAEDRSAHSIRHDLRLARAWLRRELAS